MKEKLTKTLIDSLEPNSRPVWDTLLPGFIFKPLSAGKGSWRLVYRNADGRKLTYKVGSYPGLDLEGARRLAKTAAGKVAARVDVQAEKKAARVEAARARIATLGAFIEHRYGPWALAHLRRGDVAVARLKADFAKWLEEPLATFNSWRIDSWRRDRIMAGVKPVTLNRQIDTLRAALRKAVEWGVIETHPLQGLKRLKVDDDERVRYLSAAEENRLRSALVARETQLRNARDRFNEWRAARNKAALPSRRAEFVDHIRPLVLVALNTGLRRGELFSLRWSDINLDGSLLKVRAAAAKSGDSRHVPLNAEALALLKGWQEQTRGEGEGLVFPGAEGARLTNINKAWATVVKLSELTNFRFHDVRHTFASKLVQRAVDLNTVRALMGHADLKMTLRYSHLQPENLSAAVAKLG